MNNVICIVVDSVFWECVSKNRTNVSTTPFIDSLRSEGVVANNLYSHGPYTDAATKSLYTGRNTLDDFGYFFKVNAAPKVHFDAFHDNGYETYGQYYPFYIYGPRIQQSIDHSYYTTGFTYSSEWRSIYEYYREIIENRDLTSVEFMLLKKRTELMFEAWLSFYRDVIENPEHGVLIAKALGKIDIKETYDKLAKEYDSYKTDPQTYILGIIKGGFDHPIANLDDIDVRANIDYDYIEKQIYEKYYTFFNTIRKNTRIANIKHNRPGLARTAKGGLKFIASHEKNDLRFAANYFHCLSSLDDMMENSKKYFWQNISSSRRQLDNAADILRKRRSEKPFYFSLHLLDPHEYICFFSYDIQDESVIAEEFDVLKKFVEECGTNFKGSLPYLLSLRYVDYCIERFCNNLKEMGLWESTTILITADHGSSYSYFPLHGSKVNNFDEENYHIPMIIRSPGFEGREVNHFCNSKDVFPTLLDVVGLDKPESFIGNSIISNDFKPKDYVMTEYMGPGVPDLLSRKMWFSIRDNNYLVAYKVAMNSSFADGELAEVYDLKKDPYGYYNLKDKINRTKIEYLLDHIETRFNEVCSDTQEFITRLQNGADK